MIFLPSELVLLHNLSSAGATASAQQGGLFASDALLSDVSRELPHERHVREQYMAEWILRE